MSVIDASSLGLRWTEQELPFSLKYGLVYTEEPVTLYIYDGNWVMRIIPRRHELEAAITADKANIEAGLGVSLEDLFAYSSDLELVQVLQYNKPIRWFWTWWADGYPFIDVWPLTLGEFCYNFKMEPQWLEDSMRGE